ncbi:MAG: RDD family protein [Cyanobacteriota bacterium]|nr:RDD family protein [Cyanobacteriota bacterium]
MSLLNRISLQTPESIELELTLAGIGNRAFAYAIDYILWWILLLLTFIIGGYLAESVEDLPFTFLERVENIELWILAILGLLSYGIYVGYFVFFETFWQGQTPGKRWVKIRVICDDGRPSGLVQATLRSLLRPIDDILFLGALLILLGKQEKRLGDMLAGTLVVQEEQPLTSTEILLDDRAKPLAERLVKSANIRALLPDDFAVIRTYLRRRRGMLPAAKTKLSQELAVKVKAIVELERLPQKTTTDIFLEAIYLAYQQQSSREL